MRLFGCFHPPQQLVADPPLLPHPHPAKPAFPVLYILETGTATRLINPMPRLGHYSPCINRELVRTLYHEAKHRRMPMTRLVNTLLSDALTGTEGWQITHQTPLLQEQPPDYRSGKSTAP